MSEGHSFPFAYLSLGIHPSTVGPSAVSYSGLVIVWHVVMLAMSAILLELSVQLSSAFPEADSCTLCRKVPLDVFLLHRCILCAVALLTYTHKQLLYCAGCASISSQQGAYQCCPPLGKPSQQADDCSYRCN